MDSARSPGLKALGPGSVYTQPADVAHFARTGREPVVLHIIGTGPTDTRDADADPRS